MAFETPSSDDRFYRTKSLWLDGIASRLDPGPSLAGDRKVDVAIVGGGFTGLWTAYYLKQYDPTLNVAVVERDIVGFGATGRNGGWVAGGIAGRPEVYARTADARALSHALSATYEAIDEIERVVEEETIDCAFVRAGSLEIATTPAQERRISEYVCAMRVLGVSEEDLQVLSPAAAENLSTVPGLRLACYDRRSARVDPAKLARELATVCVKHGVDIFERTEALEVLPRLVRCATGVVRASHVVRATEAFTTQLPGQRRTYLPLYSLMIATEPLSQTVWDELGWPDGLLVSDRRHLFFYAQRTSDGRIAIGGRGAPYPLGRPLHVASERNVKVRRRLSAAIRQYFPAASQARITHAWGGAIAVPRDWCMSISHSGTTGFAKAGGYGGHGLPSSNIAGRTLAALIVGRDTDLTALPWVNHKSPKWEPEPLRYLASQAIIRVLASADRREASSSRTARRTLLLAPFMPPG